MMEVSPLAKRSPIWQEVAAMGMYNTDESIKSFARSSLSYALERHYPCKLSTYNATSKAYDDKFLNIF
jgi:isocitrate dehydrogenase